jgi:ATP-dependent Zn protease
MNLLKLIYTHYELFAINTGGDRIYTPEEYKNQKKLMQMRFPKPTPYEIIDNNNENSNLVSRPDEIKIKTNEKNNDHNKINEINNYTNSNTNLNNKVTNNSNNTQNIEEKAIININDSKSNATKLTEIDNDEYNKLIQMNKRQSLLIKLSNLLFMFMALLIIILFYLYWNERNKNRNKYMRINNSSENRKKIEIED